MNPGLPDSTAFRRLKRSITRVGRTHYPRFLFGGGLSEGEIPVFTYHDIEASELEDDLRFLERNGYRTLSLDEYLDRMRASRPSAERCVLLTFDDARRSFWEAALPVLERRAAHAVLFTPTYWIADGSAARPDSDPPGFMSWEQIAHCERHALIDVEAHGHRHALVFTSSRLAGFATPSTLAAYDLFDWPMRKAGGRDVCGRPPLGTPIYESMPLLSATERVIEPELAAVTCRSLVETEGGPAFFARPDALVELRAAHAAVASRVPVERLSAAEMRREIEAELSAVTDCFRSRLGRKPRCFAYPWMLGGTESLAMLADLGFDAAFGVALDFRRIRAEAAPLPVFARYKSDWLQFLPGTGRRRLLDVLPRKISAFFATQHFAH